MPRIYTPDFHEVLRDSPAQHIRVLRLKPSDQIELFNGKGQVAQATICEISKKTVTLEIGTIVTVTDMPNPKIHLAMSLIRNDMMDLTIQKAVELGVSAITPISAERSQGRFNQEQALKKHDHWQAVIIAACEQSGLNFLPTLFPIEHFQAFITKTPASNARRFILDPYTSNTSFLTKEPEANNIILMIGPEGGLTTHESEQAKQAGFHGVKIHNNILRAETAAMAAIVLAQQN